MGAMASRHVKLENVGKDHIVIAVIGLTGVGKSTFINSAVKKDILEVGHGLTPDTRNIQHVECQVQIGENDTEHHIVFVETPGFDSERDEGEISEKLRKWLKAASSKNLKISGVLYLHRITDAKLSNPPIRHLTHLRTLCEESIKGFPNRVVLVTTMWDILKSETTGQARERELQDYWNTLPSGSAVSRIMRFDRKAPETALTIVEALMKSN